MPSDPRVVALPAPADDRLPLTVSDVRQYVYCPRIPYFRLGLRLAHRPVTVKMQEGQRAHERTEALEPRRALRTYGLDDGERHLAVALHSPRLALSGRLDMLIDAPAEAIPVEWKNSAGPLGLNHKYQLTAYALLAEEQLGRPVRRAFVYWILGRRAQPLGITPAMRAYTKRVLAAIRRVVADERMPDGTRHLERCRECEFLVQCNDRW
jgi:CRISPR-associated exonuclease Cas4